MLYPNEISAILAYFDTALECHIADAVKIRAPYHARWRAPYQRPYHARWRRRYHRGHAIFHCILGSFAHRAQVRAQ